MSDTRYDSPPPASPEPGSPAPAVPLPEAVVEELESLLATRAHTDDTPVDEAARRERAVEWAIRAERRRRFAAEHEGAESPDPTPPAPPYPAA